MALVRKSKRIEFEAHGDQTIHIEAVYDPPHKVVYLTMHCGAKGFGFGMALDSYELKELIDKLTAARDWCDLID